ncbi:MAG TPA: glycosyltransferase family 39 protein [Anaerolineales bacterium]|nr:glycosyltransferase family 39 protein [Anaerolineales bacterium]
MESVPQPKPYLKPWLTTLLLLVLFAAGLGIRLYDLTDLPNDFYMVRQYHSIVMARGIYYAHLTTIPDWQRSMAVAQWQREGLIEPPIMENIVALTYNLTGVQVWMGRVYASLFWLLGGLAIWLLAREMSMRYGGLIAVAYFLFVPFGVTVSRAFLPDPLMVAMIAWSLWALYRWEKYRTWKLAILAGVLTGLTIFVKSVAVFPMLGAAAGLVLSRASWKRIFADKQTWLVAGITVIPTVIYYIYGLKYADLGGQFALRFFPSYWKDPTFYGRWLFMAAGFSGFAAMFAALVGIILYPTRQQRFIAIGLWIGYIAYGFAFPYNFITHDYYHLPIILVVAFGLIPTVDFLVRAVAEKSGWFWKAAFIGILLFGVAMQMWVSRNTMASANYRADIAYYQALGNLIGHDKKVIEVSGDYGYRLEYWGWVDGEYWPSTMDTDLRALAGQSAPAFATEFAKRTAGMDEFVITSTAELDRQPQLRDYLAAHYPVLARGDGYLIYNLKP